jgi:hypothetical protein
MADLERLITAIGRLKAMIHKNREEILGQMEINQEK